jgi:DNA-binding transcriptional regulator PaaX
MVKVIKKLTKGDITKIMLETVKTSGLISAALIAPNVLMALEKLGVLDDKRKVIANTRARLIKNGYLQKNTKGFLSLTNQGMEKLKRYELSDYKLVIPRVWDRKWRVLIFDIPEYRRGLREKIRLTLLSIGFKRVQDSVWVFPYDCAELISLLKADFKIGKDLLYMVVESIENDGSLIKHFQLS